MKTFKQSRLHTCLPLLLLLAACGDVESVDDSMIDDSFNGSATASEALTGYGVEVVCDATNQFGYVARIRGKLSVSAHDWNAGFVVKGSLTVQTKFYDDPSFKKQKKRFSGVLDETGSYAFVSPTQSSSIDQITLYLTSSFMSAVHINSIEYQTLCTPSVVRIPQGSDLALSQTMRYYSNQNGTLTAMIHVRNIGNVPTTGGAGRVKIKSKSYNVVLHQNFGGTATTPNTLNPNEDGYLLAILPAGSLSRCAEYKVKIDLSRTMQQGQPNPFRNDTKPVKTPCLLWNTPIDAFAIGYEPPAIVKNKTLGDIVSSKTIGRLDNLYCNQCHYAGSGRPYSPPTGDILPTTSWAVIAGARAGLSSSIAKRASPTISKICSRNGCSTEGAK